MVVKLVTGEMAEWFNAAVLKTVVSKGTGGSNPSLSAIAPKWGFFFFWMVLLCGTTEVVVAQDTVRISLADFVTKGLEQSAISRARAIEVELAENRTGMARSQRILPRFDLSSNHAIVPGISTDSTKEKAFLDPNLENDWEKWGIYTRVDFQAVQPIFVWGAINNSVRAAESAAKAAEFDFHHKRSELVIRLVELYNAQLLDLKLTAVLNNTRDQFKKAEERLTKMSEDGEEVEQNQVYKFRISQYQFAQKQAEFEEQMAAVERVWNKVLGNETAGKTVYLPRESELTVSADSVNSFEFFKQEALTGRKDILGVQALGRAAKNMNAVRRAQMLPALFFGFGGEFVYTKRPVQQQPLIGDRYLFANLYYTVGFRQSLNFGVMRKELDRSSIEVRKAQESEAALKELIELELSDVYRNTRTLKAKLSAGSQALQTSKEWVRVEQIDYDLGVGELRNLVDAVKANLELDAEVAKLMFDYNVEYARLLKTAGLLEKHILSAQ